MKRSLSNAAHLLVLVALQVGIGTTCFADAIDVSALGGNMTSDLPGRHALQVPANYVTDPDRRALQISGFADFHKAFTKSEGVGPKFVNSSCGGCHVENARGPVKFSNHGSFGKTIVVQISAKSGLSNNGAPKPVPGAGGVLPTQTKGFKLFGTWKEIEGHYPTSDKTKYRLRFPVIRYSGPGFTHRTTRFSLRMTPPVIGPGLVDAISSATILALADPSDVNNDGISGKPNYVIDRRSGLKGIGKFGFRAGQVSTEGQTTAALFNEMGLTNPLFQKTGIDPEIDETTLERLVVYQQLGGVPRARNQSDPDVIAGNALFQQFGCNDCHVMTIRTDSGAPSELADQDIHPFSDFLLHDMGTGLADTKREFSAKGSEWRTTPLWGLGFTEEQFAGKQAYLHDGRARSIEEAIIWHGGEAKKSRNKFMQAKKSDRAKLIAFLKSL
ncbi:MAG: thiol oxidoreductase [Oligoflexia bacterium]|nr:thiol oxidoreductase [Oligoflexia bacterium]